MERFYPTLRTVLMVERFLALHHADLLSKAAIIRGLDGKLNNKSLTTILDYLEASNKIIQSKKGIQWIFSGNPKVKRLLKDGLIFS